METPPINTPKRRSPTSRTASPRPTKPLPGKTPKSTAPSTPKQRIRDAPNSLLLNGRKRDSPTPSDKTDSERSPSSVMLMSPGEVSEQQGSIEQVIKSIEKQLKREQDKIAKIILEKQQHQVKYKLENHMDAHLTPFVMIKKVGKSGNEGSVKKDPPVKAKTQPSTTKPSTQKRPQTPSGNLKKASSVSSKSPSANTTSQTPQVPTKRICTCGDPNSVWCFVCESRRFKNDFPKWTSGNKMIDNFIKEIQLFAESEVNYLEWISYDRFKEVKYICDGTYASLSLATWLDGPRNLSDKQNKKLKRDPRKKVMLRQLRDSEDISEVYLSELNKYYKKISWNNSIMPVYGISKDPKTKNFIIVYEHAEHGDLNNYLQENSANMGWPLKLALACDISKSLKTLHGCNLMHKDIHSGNILIMKDGSTALADFGVCKHVDAENRKLKIGQVEGVLPFIAPEVIRTQKYSKHSDIYGFSIVMWEISASGRRPLGDRSHDAKLASEILEGKRPDPVPGTPPCWVELMEQCWNDNPEKRPDAETVHRTLCDWLKKLVETPKLPYKVNTEFALAENWRIRGQYQPTTPQHGARQTSVIDNNGEEDKTSMQEGAGEESTTTTVVEPEGGIEVDASMVEGIESGLDAEEFQHPVTCYTSQLFDFGELKIFASTTTVVAEEPNILESPMSADDEKQNITNTPKSDAAETSVNEEHNTVNAPVSDNVETSVDEEHNTVNAPVSDIEGSNIINSPVLNTEEPITVNVPASEAEEPEEPSTIDVPVPETEEPSILDVPVFEAGESGTLDASISANEEPSIVGALESDTREPNTVDAPVSGAEEIGTVDASISVNASVSDIEEPSNVETHIPLPVNEEIISIDVPLWTNEKSTPGIPADGTMDVPVFVKPQPPVEKLTVNITAAINKINTIAESVRSETPDDEIEADVKSDSPLYSEASPPTSPSESEASNNNGKEGNENLNLKIGGQHRHAIELEF